MKERPLIFGAWKMRYIAGLAPGQEFQTRRVVKLPPWAIAGTIEINGEGLPEACSATTCLASIPCRYGEPGDRLWLREAWRTGKQLDRYSPAEIGERAIDAGYRTPWAPVLYLADSRTDNEDTLPDFGGEWGRYRHSQFMPRWASRLTLELLDVRVQRLQEITEEDARAEGVERLEGVGAEQRILDDGGRTQGTHPYTLAYAVLWDTLNDERPGCSWTANPFVWVLTLRRVEAAEVAG